ncbi:putative ubiquitin-conjugating enzyme E2 38 [Salvia hispanica]|uniref:putative ubiquitin-conjugating enzyme E2 38 n=1 Tax=Salvia hispanica TaxID=49212 RepID=UPI0020096311|nr:putative ubiquitin-conjugating enzyme E2 38 [Salvia hispanica]
MGSDGMNFDSVEVAKDHHYINYTSQKTNNAKIMREWRILKGNLPDSIHVQVYETRIDLLRAVIIGPAGTPYHDGLFFFDIFLPSDYPNIPPQVYYHSHGYRLNPNLYHNGILCLSLINTWSGTIQEKWTDTSTILQLLVSIQGLVLNSRPYFNEPVYAPLKNTENSMWVKRSNLYNENAFILSCTTMEKIIKRPPQNFESFVVEHFRQRAAPLIQAIDRYHQGRVVVGELGMTSPSSLASQVTVSSNFKIDLKRIRGQLVQALASHSIPVQTNPIAAATTAESEKKDEHRKKGLLGRISSFVLNKIWKKKQVKSSAIERK